MVTDREPSIHDKVYDIDTSIISYYVGFFLKKYSYTEIMDPLQTWANNSTSDHYSSKTCDLPIILPKIVCMP